MYYESYFTPHHITVYETDILATLRREQILKSLSEERSGLLIADIGCGVGDVLSGLDNHHVRIGLDLSLSCLKLARQRSSSIAFVNGLAHCLPFKSDSLHLVICLETLEHMADDFSVASEISRVLKPGGRLIVSVPYEYYFADYLSLTGHYRHYSRSHLEDLLSRVGLNVTCYLNNYPRFAALYRYVHAGLVIINMLLMRLSRDNRSHYERTLPFSKVSIYELLRHFVLNPIAARDAKLPLATLQSSTFCVAEKLPTLH